MLFGQRLVESGIVTVENVQSALKAQAVHGGRLGTNLLKKGFIDIDTLSTSLSKHAGAPAAKLKHFEQVDRSVLDLVPGALAARRRALPLATVHRGVQEILVAFRDPHDTRAIEELAIATGARIHPFIAPELCILRYLERYYGIRLELELPKPPPSALPPHPYAEDLILPPPSTWISMSDPASPLPSEPPEAPESPAEDEAPEPLPSLDALKSAAAWLPSLPPTASQPPSRTSPPVSLEATLAHLDEAEDRDAVGDAIRDYLRATFGVGLVFIVKNEIAYGWRGFGEALDDKEIGALAIPLNATSVLNLAYTKGQPFRGPPGDGEGVLQSHFFRLIHTDAPSELIVAPIAVKGRVVNLVYAQAKDRGPIADTVAFDLSTLCRSAGESFVRLIKKQKKTRRKAH